MAGLGLSDIIKSIGRQTKEYEGFRDKVYIDKNGHPTIGYGHKLTKNEIAAKTFANGISMANAEQIFNKDYNRIIDSFYKRHPQYASFPDTVRRGLEDVAYNMGSDFLNKFPSMKDALDRRDYIEAATQLLQGKKPGTDSKYLTDVGQRALDNASRIAFGYNIEQGENGLKEEKVVKPNIKKLFSGININSIKKTGLGFNM